MDDHFHTENGCLYCIVSELYGKIRQLGEDKMQLAVENIHYKKRIEEMDKQILKVKKDLKKGNKEKGKKDVDKLLKMDRKQDMKIEKCDMKMNKKK